MSCASSLLKKGLGASIISVLLSFVLAFSLVLPGTLYAYADEGDIEASPGAIFDGALFSKLTIESDLFYNDPANAFVNGGNTELIFELISGAIKLLNVEEDPFGPIDWLAEFLLGNIFKTDTSDELKKIMDALTGIQASQNKILNDLDQLKTLVQDTDTLAKINSFFTSDASTGLSVRTSVYLGAIQNLNPTGGTLEENRKNVLINSMGDTPQGVVYGQNIISTYDALVLQYGKLLQTSYMLTDGTSKNLLDVYTSYMNRHLRWEHLGYENREEFQSVILGLYSSSAAMLENSLHARIESAKAASQPTNVLESTLKQLLECNKAIKDLASGSGVVRRADDVRYYAVPGHEMLMSATAYKQTYPVKTADYTDYEPSSAGHPFLPHWDSFLHAHGDGNLGPLASWYKAVYADYGGAMTLREIFFSPTEGNITPPPGGVDNSWYFVPQDATLVYNYHKHWTGDSWDGSIFIDFVSANNAGQMPAWSNEKNFTYYLRDADKTKKDSTQTLASICRSGNSIFYHYMDDAMLEKFVMIEPLTAGLNKIDDEKLDYFVINYFDDSTASEGLARTGDDSHFSLFILVSSIVAVLGMIAMSQIIRRKHSRR